MHSIYYDRLGNEVPSVTTILQIINKPELIGWAHYMGTRNMSIDSILSKSSYFGNSIHDYLECYFTGGVYIPIFSEWLVEEDYKKAVNNFKWFMKDKTFECIFSEESRSNNTFGGTLDYYGKFNGKNMLIDFKTSKDVYPTYLLQLGGYYELIKNDVDVEGAGILIVNAKQCRFKEITRDKLIRYGEMFLILADFYIKYMKEGKGK